MYWKRDPRGQGTKVQPFRGYFDDRGHSTACRSISATIVQTSKHFRQYEAVGLRSESEDGEVRQEKMPGYLTRPNYPDCWIGWQPGSGVGKPALGNALWEPLASTATLLARGQPN